MQPRQGPRPELFRQACCIALNRANSEWYGLNPETDGARIRPVVWTGFDEGYLINRPGARKRTDDHGSRFARLEKES
jgi:hypothetical protein